MPEEYEETPGMRLLDVSEGMVLVQSFESAAIDLKRFDGDDEYGIIMTFMGRANKTDEWLTISFVIGREMVDEFAEGIVRAQVVIEEEEQK